MCEGGGSRFELATARLTSLSDDNLVVGSIQTGLFEGHVWVTGGKEPSVARINDDARQFGGTHIMGDPRVYGRASVATGGRGIL
jgi:hypothetical protein